MLELAAQVLGRVAATGERVVEVLDLLVLAAELLLLGAEGVVQAGELLVLGAQLGVLALDELLDVGVAALAGGAEFRVLALELGAGVLELAAQGLDLGVALLEAAAELGVIATAAGGQRGHLLLQGRVLLGQRDERGLDLVDEGVDVLRVVAVAAGQVETRVAHLLDGQGHRFTSRDGRDGGSGVGTRGRAETSG